MPPAAPLTLYDASIPIFVRGLTHLSNILKIAEKDSKASKTDQSVYINGRLFKDMRPFVYQVQLSCDIAKFAPFRVGAYDVPRMADDETTIKQLLARIKKTVDFLKTIDPKIMGDKKLEDKKFSIVRPAATHEFTGKSFIFTMSLPSFYFHMALAYAILRTMGVDVGKADMIGADIYP